jgi:tetrahydromethanopterin S-methyltransferase subunit B
MYVNVCTICSSNVQKRIRDGTNQQMHQYEETTSPGKTTPNSIPEAIRSYNSASIHSQAKHGFQYHLNFSLLLSKACSLKEGKPGEIQALELI